MNVMITTLRKHAICKQVVAGISVRFLVRPYLVHRWPTGSAEIATSRTACKPTTTSAMMQNVTKISPRMK